MAMFYMGFSNKTQEVWRKKRNGTRESADWVESSCWVACIWDTGTYYSVSTTRGLSLHVSNLVPFHGIMWLPCDQPASVSATAYDSVSCLTTTPIVSLPHKVDNVITALTLPNGIYLHRYSSGWSLNGTIMPWNSSLISPCTWDKPHFVIIPMWGYYSCGLEEIWHSIKGKYDGSLVPYSLRLLCYPDLLGPDLIFYHFYLIMNCNYTLEIIHIRVEQLGCLVTWFPGKCLGNKLENVFWVEISWQ